MDWSVKIKSSSFLADNYSIKRGDLIMFRSVTLYIMR